MEAVKEMESVEKIQAINKTSWIQRMKSYKRSSGPDAGRAGRTLPLELAPGQDRL